MAGDDLTYGLNISVNDAAALKKLKELDSEITNLTGKEHKIRVSADDLNRARLATMAQEWDSVRKARETQAKSDNLLATRQIDLEQRRNSELIRRGMIERQNEAQRNAARDFVTGLGLGSGSGGATGGSGSGYDYATGQRSVGARDYATGAGLGGDSEAYKAEIRRRVNAGRSDPGERDRLIAMAVGKGVDPTKAGMWADAKISENMKNFHKEVDLTLKPMSDVRKGYELLANGAFRRGLSQMATAGLRSIGAPGAELLGGLAGSVGSAIALPIAWAIGNALMQILPTALQVHETSAVTAARGSSPSQGALTEKLRRYRETQLESVSGGSSKTYSRYISAMQSTGGVDPGVMDQMAFRATMLDITQENGGPGAAEFAEAMKYGGHDRIAALLKNERIKQAAIKLFGKDVGIHAGMSQEQQERQIMAGAGDVFGKEDIPAIMVEATRGKTDVGGDARARQRSFAGRIRGWSSTMWQRITGTGADDPLTARPDVKADLDAVNAAGAKPHPDIPNKQFIWSSVSQLAEQMQTMWGGMPADAATESAGYLREIRDAVTKNGFSMVPNATPAPG